MKKILIIVIFINITFTNYVKEIVIIGNIKTKSSIIYRNIKHPINSPFNIDLAKNDQESLKKLECFENVSIENKDSLYQVYVVEKPAVTFVPIIDKEDGIGWAGGIKFNFNNVRGKTNRLYTKILFGDFEKYNIEYVDRKLGKSKYKLKIHYEASKARDIEDNFNLSHRTITFKFLTKQSNNKLGFYFSNQNNTIDIGNNSLFEIQNEKFRYIVYTLNYKNNFLFDFGNQLLTINYNYFHSQKTRHENYSSLLFKSEKNIFLANNLRPPKLKLKLLASLKSNTNLPYYENEYLGGDRYVRSFEPNPSLNHESAINKLKFFNMLIYSIELYIPLDEKINLLNNLDLMFFIDYGLGSNKYNQFDLSNKIKGFGFGCKFNMRIIEKEELIISYGMNEFGQRQIHFHTNKIIF